MLRRERLPVGARLAGPGGRWALVVEGGLTVETAAGTQTLGPGDAVLVGAATAHRLTVTVDSEVVHADLVAPPAHRARLPSPLVVRGFGPQNEGVANLASTCPLGRECSPAEFAESYAALLGSATVATWDRAQGPEPSKEDGPIGEAVAAVLARPAAGWTVDELAGVVNLSRSAFTARFRRATGRSPMQLVRDARMHRARTLLREDELPVTRIAFEVGYGSVAAFSRAFAADHDGVAPERWRLAQRAGTRSTAHPAAAIAALAAPTTSEILTP